MSSNLFLTSFFPDPLDSVLDLDILQETTDTHYNIHQESPNPVHEFSSINQISEITHPILPFHSSFSSPPFENFYNNQCFMQRSISFDGRPANLLNPNHVMQPLRPPLPLSSPEMNMRRVYSIGDLMEESIYRLGPSPYTAEERKERIQKYREKRNQRNYNKTVKYACRKTLADNRTRVRGRFARNDEPNNMIPKTATFNRFEDELDQWIDRNLKEEGTVRGGNVFSLWDSTCEQLQ